MENLKAGLLQVTFVTAIVFSFAAYTNNPTADTKEVAKARNDARFEHIGNKIDARFLVNAAEINMVEIALGELAQQNSTLTSIKELGKMMQEVHTRSLEELAALAKAKNIILPESATEKALKIYKKLSNVSGVAFERVFSDMMVSGHKEAIALFVKATIECTDPDIRTWATTTLPAIRTHLDNSMMCQEICKNL